MLADPRYWLAVVAFMCFSSAGLFVIQSGTLMSMAIGGLKEGAALVTYTVSFIGIANSGGRLLWGAISDKLGRYKSLMLMAVIVAVSALLIGHVFSGSYGLFIIFAMLIAACYGGSMGIYPAMTADNFGPKNNGINYGVMFFGFAAGGFLGPVFFTKLMEASGGSFKMPLTVVAVLGILALILIAALTKLKAGKEA
jgi:MFS family permease